MRILLISDSHGDWLSCKLAIDRHSEADVIIHLGDGEEDIDNIPEILCKKQLFRVRGNSLGSALLGYPVTLTREIGGRNFYCSHGYAENVKFGIDNFIECALKEKAEIALYGHTHAQYKGYEKNIHIMNPGTIKHGEYGLIDITDSGVALILSRLS